MKIYFAGPLFTPYVRQFISEHARILRSNGIDPFVPHENSFGSIKPAAVEALLQQGLVRQEDLAGRPIQEGVAEMMRDGRLKREQLGLPPITAQTVFDVDYGGLSSANAILAILDGTQVDDGTACEIGIFYGLARSDPSKKGIVGLMTDSRGIRKKERGFGLNYFVLGILEDYGVEVDNFPAALQTLLKWDIELKAGK
jgi:nucleoside 2-deoxyribosyltransferase